MIERVAAIAEGCWSWIEGHLDYFSFETPLAEHRGLCMTALLELMLFVTAARRAGARSEHLDRIAGRLHDEVARYDWESSLLADPGFVVSVLTVLEFLDAERAEAGWLRALVPRALVALEATDLIAYRRLEIERLLVRTELAQEKSGRFEALLRESLRPLRKPLALYTREELFALAHIVFYLTDDGEHDARRLEVDAADLAWLRARARACVHLCLHDDETDMLGEFVLCCRFLDVLDDTLLGATLDRIELARTGDGGIPNDLRAGAFVGVYHATLIWAYAGEVLACEALRA